MLNTKQINVLGNILDTTMRGSSSGPQRSITGTISGNVLILKYMTIVHFAEERALRLQVGACADESVQVLSSKLSSIKSEFKEKAGVALKLKETSSKDNIEIVQATAHSPRKIAYYRRHVQLEIEN